MRTLSVGTLAATAPPLCESTSSTYNRITFTKFVAPRAAIGCPPVITI
jgi:hypothetical protein